MANKERQISIRVTQAVFDDIEQVFNELTGVLEIKYGVVPKKGEFLTRLLLKGLECYKEDIPKR